MRSDVRWYLTGAVALLATAGGVINWHAYRARVDIAKELADDLSPRISKGRASVSFYPVYSSVPITSDELHYCGIGSMPMASRGSSDRVDCAVSESACLAKAITRLTACRKVEVEVIPNGAEQAGSPTEPRCRGGFFGARVCLVRQQVTTEHSAPGDYLTMRVTVH